MKKNEGVKSRLYVHNMGTVPPDKRHPAPRKAGVSAAYIHLENSESLFGSGEYGYNILYIVYKFNA